MRIGRQLAGAWLLALALPALAGPVAPADILGSWLVVEGPRAAPTEIQTFNPDGSRVVSDGMGRNEEDGWELFEDTISLGETEVEVWREGDRLHLGDTVLEPFRLEGVRFEGPGPVPQTDLSGVYLVPEDGAGRPMVGGLTLKDLRIGPPDAFAGTAPPFRLDLWDETEPLVTGPDGAATRPGLVRFEGRDWTFAEGRIALRATHPDWGEAVLVGRFEPGPGPLRDGRSVTLRASLLLSGAVFRDLPFTAAPLR